MKHILRALALVVMVAGIASCARESFDDMTKDEYQEAITGGRSTGIQFSCPMHPEVVQYKPGKCPKCGMALVRKTPEPGGKQ